MNFFEQLFFCKETVETTDGFVAKMQCNPEHPVYQAHFPGNPITPGACLLMMAGKILGQKLGKTLLLKSSKNIKFLNVLIPAEGKAFEYSFTHFTESESGFKVQVVIADETTVYSKMSLTYSYASL